MAFEDFFDDVTDIAMAHIRLTQRVLVDLRQLTDGVADYGVTQIQLPLVAVGERPSGEIDRRQRQGGVVEAGEVLAQHPGFLEFAAGRADRLAGQGQRLHGG